VERLRRIRFYLRETAAVADIAMKWGFNHFGWFSADYCAAYGELPRQTLAVHKD
jgi:transcriptional regulator GlxA family with amidase domain